jgi:zinc protease
MSEAEAIADWRFYKDYSSNIERVTADDVQRVARAYLHEDNRTVGHFIPRRASSASESNGANGNGGNGASKLHENLSEARALFPRGVKFYDEPVEEDSRSLRDATDASLLNEAGGSTTPQELEQKGVPARGSKSSDAAQANTPQSVGLSNFAARVVRHQLENGATVLMLENRATPTVSLRGSLRAGSYFEPRDKPGLAQLTAEMLSRGTEKRSKLEIAGDLESVGADIDFSTDPFAVNIAARALSQDLPLVISTLAEELREPAFPADELERLKQQLIASIQEQQANTRYRGYERFSNLIFDETNPYHVPPGDRIIESINSITTADVQEFFEQRYGGRSLILSVVGDVYAADVRGQFEEAFGSFDGPASVDINVTDPEHQSSARREIVLIKDKANVDILVGAAAPLRRSSEDIMRRD